MKWNIIADSSCDLFKPETLTDNINYLSVPFFINIEAKEYMDDEKLDTSELVTAMKESKKASSTACPSPEAWFEKMDKDAYNILVTISKNLSGSYNSALIATQMFNENGSGEGKVAVVDGHATGPAAVLAIRKLTQLISEGFEFEEVVSKTEVYIKGMNTVFALSCFDNLIKAGRMGKLAGVLAASLDFRGVGVEDDGRIKFKAKVRGKKKMIETMIDVMRENNFGGGEVVISHCYNEALAQKLSEEIKSVWDDTEITVMPTRGLNSYYAEKGGLIVSYR
ncbi:MAG: DegV family protein [Clostridia bacterium]|nr:DegV family protein [Clostridia bacterium]